MFIKLSAALLTFLIGVGGVFVHWDFRLSSQLRSEVAAPLSAPVPIETTLCQAAEQKNFFDGKLISFEATAYVVYNGMTKTIILYPENCYYRGDVDLIFAKLELDSYLGNASNLNVLLERRKGEPREEPKEVDVKVTGTAKIVTEADGYKMYSITPVDIQIISSFRDFTPKGAA